MHEEKGNVRKLTHAQIQSGQSPEDTQADNAAWVAKHGPETELVDTSMVLMPIEETKAWFDALSQC